MERPETYVRQLAEAELRHAATAPGSPGAGARLRIAVDPLPAMADSVHGDVEVALAVRSADPGTLLHLRRRAPFPVSPVLPGIARTLARSGGRPSGGRGGSHEGSFGGIGVVPVNAVLRVRADSTRDNRGGPDGPGDEDIYLLGFVSRPGRAWLAVAARTNERPAFPPSARNAGARRPAPATFAGGGMTAVDDAGRQYHLGFADGGGGKWYLGEAARLAAVLPAGDGTIVVLAGLIAGAGGITIIFGGLYLGPDPAGAASASDLSMWLRDDAGGWHTATVSGWSSDGGNGVSFEAIVLPPLSPATSEAEFHVLSGTGRIRAVLPLEWWSTS
ncbi:MAG: hypothetical protein ACRDN0_32295 [Trebonia sp.]